MFAMSASIALGTAALSLWRSELRILLGASVFVAMFRDSIRLFLPEQLKDTDRIIPVLFCAPFLSLMRFPTGHSRPKHVHAKSAGKILNIFNQMINHFP